MPVTKSELPGSPKEAWTRTGFQATRQFECAWAERENLKKELLGSVYAPLDDTGSICTKVGSVPFQAEISEAPAGVAAYEKALVTGEWTVQQGETVGENQVSESIEPNAEFLTVSHRGLTWGDGGDPLAKEEAPGRLYYGLDYVRTRFGITPVPATVLTFIGHVNKEAGGISPLTVGLSGWTFAQETLLFMPPTIVRVVDKDGNLLWDITYRFSYKPNGWNTYWRKKTEAWEKIWNTATDGNFEGYPPVDGFGAL